MKNYIIFTFLICVGLLFFSQSTINPKPVYNNTKVDYSHITITYDEINHFVQFECTDTDNYVEISIQYGNDKTITYTFDDIKSSDYFELPLDQYPLEEICICCYYNKKIICNSL